MGKLKLFKYVLRLIKAGHLWQYRSITEELNQNKSINKYYFLPEQFFSIFLSFVFLIVFKTGINTEFVGFIIAVLSIFIGIYISLIILLFDKFCALNFDTSGLSFEKKVSLLKKRNFFQQFTSLTSYSILLAILLIILLSLSFWTVFQKEIDLSMFFSFIYEKAANNTHSFTDITFIELFRCSFCIALRAVTYYFLLDFLMILIYSITSMYSFISKQYKDQKIQLYN